MLSVAEFFAESHRGNRFGQKGPLYGLGGHRGDDTNGWRAGTAIPWIGTGVVVRSERQAGLGWVVTLRDPRGIYISNCHMQTQGVAVGKTIRYVGEYAGPIGNTGTLSLGVHDHVVVSRTSSNPATGLVIDPRPFINAAKLAQAGGGAVPLDPDAPAAPQRPKLGDDDMFSSRYITRATGPNGKREWALLCPVLPNGYETTQDLKIANGWAALDPTGGVETDDEHWARTLSEASRLTGMYWARLAAVTPSGSGGQFPSAEQIGAEVIRQQKLPGN